MQFSGRSLKFNQRLKTANRFSCYEVWKCIPNQTKNSIRYTETVPLKIREVVESSNPAAGGLCEPRATIVFFEADGRITVVSGRLGDDVRRGTYKAILKQTGIEEDKT